MQLEDPKQTILEIQRQLETKGMDYLEARKLIQALLTEMKDEQGSELRANLSKGSVGIVIALFCWRFTNVENLPKGIVYIAMGIGFSWSIYYFREAFRVQRLRRK